MILAWNTLSAALISQQPPAKPTPAPTKTVAPQNPPTSAEAKALPAKDAVAGTVSTTDNASELTDTEKAILQSMDKLVVAFNTANLDQLVGSFVKDGELIDEQGNVYQGHDAIRELGKSFFEKYPGSKTIAEIDSVRSINDLVLVEGFREINSKDDSSSSLFRFTAIWTKAENGHKLVSFREQSEGVMVSPHEALESLSWLVGDWMNEGTDARVKLSYAWSEDRNFILGEIQIAGEDKKLSKSTTRLAWDASEGVIRSWTFDSDGGFGESVWLQTDEGWAMVSAAVTPEGQKGSASVSVVQVDTNRFKLVGKKRVVGTFEEPDFEIVIVKTPPKPSK